MSRLHLSSVGHLDFLCTRHSLKILPHADLLIPIPVSALPLAE
jgi:hypothetical protein